MSNVHFDAAQWQRDGVLILRQFFADQAIAEINNLIDRLWAERTDYQAATTIDAYLEQAHSRRLLFARAPDAARRQPYKINDLYLEEESIRTLILDRRLCTVLSRLLNGEPLVCNSLNFEFGSQQQRHIDTLYMPPRRDNKLAVSWIALDAVDAANGPVTYYPGSHKIPPYRFSTGKLNAVNTEMNDFNRHIEFHLADRGIEAVEFQAQPGDVLIWHAQLLHGGSPIQNRNRSRRSLVTHYFRRQDYRHMFWRIKKQHNQGYYLKRRHPPVS